MFPTVHRRFATGDIEVRLPRAGFMLTTLAANVYNPVLSMLLAIHRRFAADDIEVRSRLAGVM